MQAAAAVVDLELFRQQKRRTEHRPKPVALAAPVMLPVVPVWVWFWTY